MKGVSQTRCDTPFVLSRLQRLEARVISQCGCVEKTATSTARLMPATGQQDVGHATIATGGAHLSCVLLSSSSFTQISS